jgi:hypothetical protein
MAEGGLAPERLKATTEAKTIVLAKKGRHILCMKRVVALIVVFISTVIVPISAARPASATNATCPVNTVQWTGGVDYDWHTAANWSTNAVPTSSDDVCVDGSLVGGLLTIEAADDAQAKSLTTINDTDMLINPGGSLTLTNDSVIENVFSYGTIHNAADLTVTGLFAVDDGELDGGTLHTGPQSSASLSSNAVTINEAWTSSGDVQMASTVDLQMPNGSLTVAGGRFTADCYHYAFNVGGDVNVQAGGDLWLYSENLSAPHLDVAANGKVEVYNSSITAAVTSSGTFQADDGTIGNVLSSPTITGSFTQNGGTYVERTNGTSADHLAVSGAATISGSTHLSVITLGGYIGSTTAFPVITAGTVSGNFAAVDAPSLVNTNASTSASSTALSLNLLAQSATVSGHVYKDVNGDGSLNGDTTPVANTGVFNDTNNDGVHQVGEPSTTTDANGAYSFTVTNGALHVRALPSANYAETAHSANADGTLAGVNVSGVDLGVYEVPSPAGVNSGNVTVPQDPASQGTGYWMVGTDGNVYSYGSAQGYGSPASLPSLNAPIIDMTATPGGGGYWVLGADGGVFSYGDAQFYGSTGSIHLNQPAVSMVATPDGNGYWFVAKDGGVFAYGDAGFYGSAAGVSQSPVVAMVATPDGRGYWLIAKDGGVFAYGDAAYHGSMGGQHLNSPIVGAAATHSGNGYWLVSADGGVFAFGDAPFYGSAGSLHLSQPIVSMRAMTNGGGYTLIAKDGGVFNYGGASFYGTPVGSATSPIAN